MCLSLQTLLSTFADNIYSNWIPLFLSQVHHLEFKKMGIFAALPLLGGAIAGVLGGALNDYWIARTGNRRWSRAGVAMAGKGMAAVLMFAAGIFYDRPYVFCMFLFFIKLCGDWSLTSSWGVVADIGGRTTASVFAVQNSVAGLGLIAAPIVFGYVADHYGWQLVLHHRRRNLRAVRPLVALPSTARSPSLRNRHRSSQSTRNRPCKRLSKANGNLGVYSGPGNLEPMGTFLTVSGGEWDSRHWDKSTSVRERVFRLAAEACLEL